MNASPPACIRMTYPPTFLRTLLALLAIVALGSDLARADEGLDFFERRIRPVLVKHCYECHSAKSETIQGGLRLDSSTTILAGGDSGPMITKGQPGDSLLMAAVSYSGEFSDMPPAGKLPDRVIDDFRQWIKSGAALPAEDPPADLKPRATVDIEQGRQFWAFQPVREQELPQVKNNTWLKRRHDSFVLEKLEAQQLTPAVEADRRTFIKRVTFDLLGLPPTLAEITGFENDTSPDAYEQLVNRLLASPHYGERWGRHWLDIARYAEDNPTSEATCKPPPYPWPYRDWVIDALNDDLGYDEFVRRQLAADLMQELPPEQVAATGFLGLSPVYHKEPKLSADVISVIVADEWDERLDTISRGLLGVTLACARCHDHKFDPFRVQDYYALAGVIASTQLVEWPLEQASAEEAGALTATREGIVEYQLRVSYAKNMRKAAEIDKQPTEPFEKMAQEYQATLDELKERKLFAGPIANVVRDAAVIVNGDDPDWTEMEYHPGESHDLPIFIRGNPNNPGQMVPRRFIEVLTPGTPTPFGDGSGRLQLADAIFTDAAGLAARVIVNRVWGWHFGQPLSRTPSNLGALGERPSHVELLDDLAARFIANGWSLKWLHREIVLSATYRQASVSKLEEQGQSTDPENRLLWKMNRLRLEPEAWRDAVLKLSGRLDETMFGKSAELDEWKNQRRTIYGTVSRQKPATVLQLFDFPDAKRHADQRILTTTPLQQLYLLNSPFLQKHAEQIASDAPKKRAIMHLFETILLRQPTGPERRNAKAMLKSVSSRELGLKLLAHSLLASNEFLFVD